MTAHAGKRTLRHRETKRKRKKPKTSAEIMDEALVIYDKALRRLAKR